MRAATLFPKQTAPRFLLTTAASVVLLLGGVDDIAARETQLYDPGYSSPRYLSPRDPGYASPRYGSPRAAPPRAFNQSPISLTQSALREYFLSGQAGAKALEAFYAERDFLPVWTGSLDATRAGVQVRTALTNADQQGLDSAAYASRATQSNALPAPGTEAARYDVALTEALIRYAHDLRVGRISPKDVYRDIDLPASNFDAYDALAAALKTRSIDKFLADLAPAHPGYHWLAAALARYRGIAAQGGWPSLTSTSGTDARNVKLLAERLSVEDPMLANEPSPSSDALREALKRYQARNGLSADGRIGRDTLAALNVPVAARIQQIVANMERWRWVPALFEHRYVSINVPDQTLVYVQDGKALLHSRVIVGRKDSRTPILRSEADALVANPPWNVPGDIAAAQLLPHLVRDPNYLASRNMVVVNGPIGDPRGRTIQWRSVSADQFSYQIRQLPGPNSAMGLLMLDAPNDFDVYLHDTPGKKFFADDERDISNGCIRVQEMAPLASLALTGDSSAGMDQVKQAIAGRETLRIPLKEPLPIYMLYWTAIADADGNVGFRPDRYTRDSPLIAALDNKIFASR